MNALTRFESTTPVRYDVMNDMCTEVEARDTNLQEQINDLNGKFVTWQCDILNLRNGFASIGNTPAYFNRVGSLVAINNMILQTSSAIVVSGTVILEGIPIELRPSTLRGIILKGLDGKSYNAVVTPTGTVYCDNSITAWATGISIDISCSYNL